MGFMRLFSFLYLFLAIQSVFGNISDFRLCRYFFFAICIGRLSPPCLYLPPFIPRVLALFLYRSAPAPTPYLPTSPHLTPLSLFLTFVSRRGFSVKQSAFTFLLLFSLFFILSLSFTLTRLVSDPYFSYTFHSTTHRSNYPCNSFFTFTKFQSACFECPRMPSILIEPLVPRSP